VIHNVKLLAELLGQFLGDQAGERIAGTAGPERHDHLDRPIRISRFCVLRVCRAAGKERDADGCCD